MGRPNHSRLSSNFLRRHSFGSSRNLSFPTNAIGQSHHAISPPNERHWAISSRNLSFPTNVIGQSHHGISPPNERRLLGKRDCVTSQKNICIGGYLSSSFQKTWSRTGTVGLKCSVKIYFNPGNPQLKIMINTFRALIQQSLTSLGHCYTFLSIQICLMFSK